MAGPAIVKTPTDARHVPQFGTATHDDLPGFLGIMQMIHQEPTSTAFARLLTGQQRTEDEVPLAHLFEEISTLAMHGLIVGDLLYDAFAIDYYWDALRGRINEVRRATGNAKFCENFEATAEVAREYRIHRPAKRH